jgi:hypothetical protein
MSLALRGPLLACLALAFLSFTAVAEAATTESEITTPAADPYTALITGEDPTLLVAGTANGTAVDIRCYTSDSYQGLASGVPVTAGQFSTTIHLNANFPSTGCELRAVDPSDTSFNHGPGVESDPFEGVYVRLSRISTSLPFTGASLEYEVEANGPSGLLEFTSGGECPLGDSNVYDAVGNPSEDFFDCSGGTYQGDFERTRSGIRVDGVDAYTVIGAHQIEGWSAPLPGHPTSSFTYSVDPLTGAATVVSSEQVVKCSPGGSFPPDSGTDCTSFVPTGVSIENTMTASHGGALAVQNSRWTSTDSQPHEIDALYEFGAEAIGNPVTQGSFQFPGEAGFSQRSKGETVDLPAGPSAYFYKSSHLLPNAGDGRTAMGGFVYASEPDGPLTFTYSGDMFSPGYDWELPYQRTVPAGGDLTLSFGYAQGLSLSAVQTLAAAAEASFSNSGGGTDVPISVPDKPIPPAAAAPKLELIGKPRVRGSVVTLRLQCAGSGDACRVRANLTAGRKGYGRTAKEVAAGSRGMLRVGLNTKGRKILKRVKSGRLALKLTVVQNAPGPVRTLLARKVALKRGG